MRSSPMPDLTALSSAAAAGASRQQGGAGGDAALAWYRAELARVQSHWRAAAESDLGSIKAALGSYREQVARLECQKRVLLNRQASECRMPCRPSVSASREPFSWAGNTGLLSGSSAGAQLGSRCPALRDRPRRKTEPKSHLPLDF